MSRMAMPINSSLIMGAFLAVSVLSYSNASGAINIPKIQMVNTQAYTTTPKMNTSLNYDARREDWYEYALDLIPDAREFTPEEAARYEVALYNLFEPTGRNFFDYD